jgi:ferric-dicitrate binding protein FerR (iron transport regulator)
MTPADEFDADRVHTLMMAALDGECSEADRRELDAQLAQRPDLRDEWRRLSRVKEVTMSMDVARPPEEVWDRFRVSVAHRSERGLAWTLIAAGGAILAAFAIVQWVEQWLAMDVPPVIKIASGAVVAGGALLLFSVVRERWVLSRRDPYSKEVLR